MNEKLAQTYVFRGEKAFFVSTINRESSAMVGLPALIYAETLVWEWNPETRERGGLIGQRESCQDSLKAHQRIVARLFETGCADDLSTPPDGGL